MKSMTLWLTMILLVCCPVCQGMAESPEDAVETDVTPMVSLPSFMVEEYRSIADTLDLVSLVQEGYFGEVAEEDLLEGAVAGMLASLGDPYTFYYTPEAYAEIWEEDEGEYAGIGILISANYQSQICTCIRTFTGSPAEAAGVVFCAGVTTVGVVAAAVCADEVWMPCCAAVWVCACCTGCAEICCTCPSGITTTELFIPVLAVAADVLLLLITIFLPSLPDTITAD